VLIERFTARNFHGGSNNLFRPEKNQHMWRAVPLLLQGVTILQRSCLFESGTANPGSAGCLPRANGTPTQQCLTTPSAPTSAGLTTSRCKWASAPTATATCPTTTPLHGEPKEAERCRVGTPFRTLPKTPGLPQGAPLIVLPTCAPDNSVHKPSPDPPIFFNNSTPGMLGTPPAGPVDA
jgi:hypothetical protein